MPTLRSSLVHPNFKTKYRIRNWAEYERGLRARGDVTVWFSEEAIDAWTPPNYGKRGGRAHVPKTAAVTTFAARRRLGQYRSFGARLSSQVTKRGARLAVNRNVLRPARTSMKYMRK